MTEIRRYCFALILSLLGLGISTAVAQQGQQPPPFTAPASPEPAATQAPGQQAPPVEQRPAVPPNAPLPHPDQSSITVRILTPMSTQPAGPIAPSTDLHRAEDSRARPTAEAPSDLHTHLLSLVGPYRTPHEPALSAGSTVRLESLIRDGKLYLRLHDAIALAIENNLDVEVSRYNLLLADTDLVRAQGGGTLRGIDYTVEQTPAGVGATTSPLLVTQTTGNQNSTNVNISDLSQVNLTGTSTQENLSQNGATTFSAGPSIPLFDPTLTGQAGYLRRSDQVSLVEGTGAATGTQEFVSTGIDYQQGLFPRHPTGRLCG